MTVFGVFQVETIDWTMIPHKVLKAKENSTFTSFINIITFMAVSKNQRRIEVFQAIQKLKRARPADIIKMVAPKLGADIDNQAFKRAIHRDLKTMLDAYQLGVDYYTPAGELIEPGDEANHANLRVEYFIPSYTEANVDGVQRLIDRGGELFAAPSLEPCLHFCEKIDDIPANSYSLSLSFLTASDLHLWLPKEDRPLKFLFARLPKKLEQSIDKMKVLSSLPKRTALILLPHKNISRLKESGDKGHCLLEFETDENKISIYDHESTIGTQWTSLSVEDFMSPEQTNDRTMESSMTVYQWEKVEQKTGLNLPGAIKISDLLITVNAT